MAKNLPPVVTRFAPSPTGLLHIGGARTALFNRLFARHNGGRFLLRIEDTDRARSNRDAIAAIIEGLEWLGLSWDDEVRFQSEFETRHRAVAQDLLEEGKAYRCFATPEELRQMREEQKAAGRPVRYDARWRDRDPDEAPQGAPYVIRIKAPRTGETVIEDRVQGRVAVANEQLDDMVLLRSDGSPTYMLSVVVDDHDMGITHIIRGDDHLSNAFRQRVLYDALGWQAPEFAHIPLIHGPDGTKLSKRHGALGVESYREMGYLPAALRNYLLRLGWGHGDKEIFSEEEAVALFGLEGIGKAAARFDFKKLDALNAHYLREGEPEEIVSAALPFFEAELERPLDQAETRRLVSALPHLAARAKTLRELAAAGRFLFLSRPLEPSEDVRKILGPEARDLLGRLRPEFEKLDKWDAEALGATVADFAAAEGLTLKDIGPLLRGALTGSMSSPGIFDVLALLGREESLARLRDQGA